MNAISKIMTWKTNILFSVILLVILIVFDFYGVYTNKFYFLKFDNYLFPILSLVHFLYLYVVWFKITEGELPDPKMRNLEYALYVILAFYLFKVYDSAVVLNSFSRYQNHILPASFKPMAIITLVLHIILPLMTVVSFWLRKKYVGKYNFENYNDNLHIWH